MGLNTNILSFFHVRLVNVRLRVGDWPDAATAERPVFSARGFLHIFRLGMSCQVGAT